MIIAGTGHRPDKLGGYTVPNPIYIKVCQQIEKHLLDLKPEKVISGMCIGYDMWLANIALKLKIPLVAAIPFKNQECKWNKDTQKIYNILLSRASEQIIVSEGEYAASKMQIRNQWMVDNCDTLLACYNGDASGGTFNCIKYAKSVNKEIIYIPV